MYHPYNYHEYVINASSLRKVLNITDIALRIYMGAVLKRYKWGFGKPETGGLALGNGMIYQVYLPY